MYKESKIYNLPNDIKLKIFDFLFFKKCSACNKYFLIGFNNFCNEHCYLIFSIEIFRHKTKLFYYFLIFKFQILVDNIINILLIMLNIYICIFIFTKMIDFCKYIFIF